MVHKSNFVDNLKKVLSFTFIGQAIPFLFTPLLTRLYSESDFGQYSIFLSIISILSLLLTLRLDFSIYVQKSKEKIKDILNLIVQIQPIFFLVLTIISSSLFIFKPKFITFNPIILLFVPITACCQAIFLAHNSLLNKNQRYNEYSLLKALPPLLISLLSIVFAFILDNSVGQIVAMLVTILLIATWILFREKKWKLMKSEKILLILNENQKFIKYSLPADLLNSLNNFGFPLILYFFYDLRIVGFYFLALKLVKAPLSILFNSISSIYNQEASDLINENKYIEVLQLTRKLQIRIALLLFPLLLLASILSPIVFDLILGENWRYAGELIKYFAILVFFNGIYSPISQIGNFLEKQKILLMFNLSLISSTIFCFIFLSEKYEFELVLLVSSVVGAIHFIWLNYYMNNQIQKNVEKFN